MHIYSDIGPIIVNAASRYVWIGLELKLYLLCLVCLYTPALCLPFTRNGSFDWDRLGYAFLKNMLFHLYELYRKHERYTYTK